MSGLKQGINLLVDYDPEWPIAFEEGKARICSVLGRVARAIEHYGLTAVAGLRAKPIIAILLGVAPPQAWSKWKLLLEKPGYDYAENAGVPANLFLGEVVIEVNAPTWCILLSSVAKRGYQTRPFVMH